MEYNNLMRYTEDEYNPDAKGAIVKNAEEKSLKHYNSPKTDWPRGLGVTVTDKVCAVLAGICAIMSFVLPIVDFTRFWWGLTTALPFALTFPFAVFPHHMWGIDVFFAGFQYSNADKAEPTKFYCAVRKIAIWIVLALNLACCVGLYFRYSLE